MNGEEPLALDVEAKSNFVSIRANTAVFSDTFYYEVTLLSDGLMQIGWCSINTTFNSSDGVVIVTIHMLTMALELRNGMLTIQISDSVGPSAT